MRNCIRYIPIVLTLLLFGGCAHLTAAKYTKSKETNSAWEYYKYLDKTIKDHRRKDAANFPVPGYPYLRANRFLVGLKEKIDTDEKFHRFIEISMALETDSRGKEIQNLPQEAVDRLASLFELPRTRKALLVRARQSSDILYAFDQRRENFKQDVLRSFRDPGEYSFVMRALGLYPLVSIAINIGADSSYNKFREWHKTPYENLPVIGDIRVYNPPVLSGLAHTAVVKRFIQTPRDAFGFPRIDQKLEKELFLAFAPVYAQDVKENYDRFGKVVWRDGKVSIDTERPTAYTYVTYAFVKDQPLVQLNYATWYPRRDGEMTPWLEEGRLDGLTFRVSLNRDGEVVMTDAMNNCGCYFFFMPSKDKVRRIIPARGPFAPDPLVPAWLPADYPETRLALRINSGWHQVQNVVAKKLEKTDSYVLRPYDQLESLKKDSGFESVFNRHGIMKDSSRIEPFIFFSAGIPKVGYMRQRGNHPIKLVGVAYLTDPHLFNKNFVFE